MSEKKFKVKNTAGMFDLIKGVTMLVVIYVHTYSLFPLTFVFKNTYQADFESSMDLLLVPHILITIYSMFVCALMPLFFSVSGYGIRKMSFKKSVCKQAKTLLYPYIVTTIITTILHLCTHYTLYRYLPDSVKETCRIAGGFLLGLSKTSEYNGVKIFSCGPIWYILALFWGLIIFNLLLNYLEEKYLPYASLAIAFVGWLLSLGNTVPWCISQGLVAVFYICLGYFAKKKKWFTEGVSKRATIILLLLTVFPDMVIRFVGVIDGMADNVYPFSILTILINGFVGLFTIALFLQLNRFSGIITSFLRKIGRYSIYVLCVHTIEMMGFPYYYFANKWTGNVAVGSTLLYVIRAGIDIAICFGFVAIKDKIINIYDSKMRRE